MTEKFMRMSASAERRSAIAFPGASEMVECFVESCSAVDVADEMKSVTTAATKNQP
jgi:hypothetical protein